MSAFQPKIFYRRASILLNRFDALVDNEYQEHYREMSFMSEFHSKAQQFWASKLAQVKIALESINGMTITVCD